MKIQADGVGICYEISGRRGAPVVMLSHSLGSTMAMWERQMASLAAEFRVLRYDIRGHGGSDAPGGSYTLEQLVADAAALMDALGMDQVHWVGLSMGGMIGQGLALGHANRLKSLALCDTAAAVPADARPIWEGRVQTARTSGLGALVDETMARWFTAPFLAGNPPEVHRIRELFLATSLAGFIGCSHAIRRVDYLDRLREIRLPTLIIVGEDDPGTPVSAAQAMHERIAGSKLVIIPSAAHLSNVEQPEAFNEALLGFLREQ